MIKLFKYQFECADENFIRNKFQNLMDNDRPCGRGIWGNNLYRQGIHFTEYSEKIKGFYIDSSENESARSSSIKIYFSGKFVYEENKTVFKVYIYPRIIEIVILIIAAIMLLITAKIVGIPFIVIIFTLLAISYYRVYNKTIAEFQNLIK